jgi:hypothetical protein
MDKDKVKVSQCNYIVYYCRILHGTATCYLRCQLVHKFFSAMLASEHNKSFLKPKINIF